MGWKCNCGLMNSGVNDYCPGKLTWKNTEHYQVSSTSLDYLMILKAERDFDHMTEQEAEFTQFFNNERTLIASMSDDELEDHITELEAIAREAKARLTAAKTHKRDKEASKRVAAKDWSITPVGADPLVTDSVNKVELRRKRMTKLDKMQSKLQALGLDPKDIDVMMSGLRKTAQKDTPQERVETAKRVAEVIVSKTITKIEESKDNSAQVSKPEFQPAEEPTFKVDYTKLKFRE